MGAMAAPYWTVDAFTSAPFAGNPAAVVWLEAPRDAAWMRSVAREMNLSETAFIHPEKTCSFGLRWFTPAVEVRLCGHATLATAHVLAQEGQLARGSAARFETLSGVLTARAVETGIELDFPARPARPAEPPAGLLEALGARAIAVARSAEDWLVELADEDAVRALSPDFRGLGRIDARGVIATARARVGPHDFVSRFFAPAAGIDEDPVTGSAHCTLAPWWAAKLGRTELLGFQASARGGEVRTRLARERVLLTGGAVTVARGQILV